MRCMPEMDAFISYKNESSLVVANFGPMWKRVTSMRNKRLMGGLTMELETSRELADVEEDEEELEAVHFHP